MTMATENKNNPTVSFADFEEYAADWKTIGRGKAIHLEGANLHGLKFNSNSGDKRWIKHTPANQQKNNDIRTAFLNALKSETELDVHEFPKALKSVLNIDDFGLVGTEANSGKPLTAYRINAVCTVLKSEEVKEAIKMIKKQKCIDRMSDICTMYKQNIEKFNTIMKELLDETSQTSPMSKNRFLINEVQNLQHSFNNMKNEFSATLKTLDVTMDSASMSGRKQRFTKAYEAFINFLKMYTFIDETSANDRQKHNRLTENECVKLFDLALECQINFDTLNKRIEKYCTITGRSS